MRDEVTDRDVRAGCILLLALVAFGIAAAVLVGDAFGVAWGIALLFAEIGTVLAIIARGMRGDRR